MGRIVQLVQHAPAPVGIRPRGGGFSPLDIAGLKLWLDSTRITGLSDSAGVASWIDLSGNGNNATQGTGAQQPKYYTTTQTIGNSKPVVWFNGVANYSLATPSMFGAAWNTATTAFIVASKLDKTAFRLHTSAGAGGTEWYTSRIWGGSDGGQALGHTNLSVGSTSYALFDSSLTSSAIETYRYNGAAVVERWNGTQRKTAAITGNLGLTGALTIGRINSGASFLWDGGIGSVIMYNAALTDAECLLVERYLSTVFGISTLPNVVSDGDSLTAGTGAVPGTSDYVTQLQALLGGATVWDKFNAGVASQTLADMESNAAQPESTGNFPVDFRHNGVRPRNILAAWGGTNDIFFGANAATTQARLTTYWASRRAAGWKVVAFTLIPRGDDVPGNATRATVNAWIRTQGASYDALVDVAADARLQDFNDLTYFSVDTVHLNATGYAVVASLAYPQVVTL